MKSINQDYNYIYRMLSAREREIKDYNQLVRESKNAMTLAIVLCFDIIIGIFAWLVYYT